MAKQPQVNQVNGAGLALAAHIRIYCRVWHPSSVLNMVAATMRKGNPNRKKIEQLIKEWDFRA